MTVGADPIAAYLDGLRRDRRLPRRQRRRVVAEIEAHLRDLAAAAEARGLPPTEAAAWAVSQFGEGQLVADQFAELHPHRGRRTSRFLAVSLSLAGVFLAATAGLLGVRDGNPVAQLSVAEAAFSRNPTLAQIASNPQYWECRNMRDTREFVPATFRGPIACTVRVETAKVRSQPGTVFDQMLPVIRAMFSQPNRARLTIRVFGELKSGGIQMGSPSDTQYPYYAHYGQILAVRCSRSQLPAAAWQTLSATQLHQRCSTTTNPNGLSGPMRPALPGPRVLLRLLHWPKTFFVSSDAGCSEISAVFSVNRPVVALLGAWPDPAPPMITAGTHVASACIYTGDVNRGGSTQVRLAADATKPGIGSHRGEFAKLSAEIILVYRATPYPVNQSQPTSWQLTYARMVQWCVGSPACAKHPPVIH